MLKDIDKTVCFPKDLSEQEAGEFILVVGLRHYGVVYIYVDEVQLLQSGLMRGLKKGPTGFDAVLTWPGTEPWFLLDRNSADLLSRQELYDFERSNVADFQRMKQDIERIIENLTKPEKKSWSDENEGWEKR